MLSMSTPSTPGQPQQQIKQEPFSIQQPFPIANEEEEKKEKISLLIQEMTLDAHRIEGVPRQVENTIRQEKKIKKRKSELALEMTADDVDNILGETNSNGFNPKHPFGPSPSGIGCNGFGDLGSPSSSYLCDNQKASPPAPKYSQNNQGQRSSPQAAATAYTQMSPYHMAQMNSPLIQQRMNSSPPANGMAMSSLHNSPLTMHSPQMGVPNHPHPLHIPHHTRLLQHQQSAPNLRQPFEDLPMPHQLVPLPGNRPFDPSLVEEFEMCVRAILMAANRSQCRNVYRQLTAEVSELYSRVVKNQVPKKAVKKITAARAPCTANERFELERQFKCLSDGLESRRSPQLYESIVNFLYKMRIAIPDA